MLTHVLDMKDVLGDLVFGEDLVVAEFLAELVNVELGVRVVDDGVHEVADGHVQTENKDERS